MALSIVFGKPVLAPPLEGATIDLQPRAVDASGNTVTGVAITWTSSDTTIATVTTSQRKWFAQTNPSERWAPAIANNVVYAYTGLSSPNVQAFDATMGQQLYQIADGHFVGTSAIMDVTPAIGATNDLLVTQGGRLLSFDLSGKKVGWTNSMIATTNPLFVSSSSNIYAVDLATRATVFTSAGTGRLSIPAQGILLVAQTGQITQIRAK
ncbi:MAG TPA: hypothetical protein VGM82_16130 [Gemmatimonadaceae bacterium]